MAVLCTFVFYFGACKEKPAGTQEQTTEQAQETKPEENSDECPYANKTYVREYKESHFIKNPEQTITSIQATFKYSCGGLEIDIKKRGSDKIYIFDGQRVPSGEFIFFGEEDGGQVSLRSAQKNGKEVIYLKWDYSPRFVDPDSWVDEEDSPGYYDIQIRPAPGSADDNFKLYLK